MVIEKVIVQQASNDKVTSIQPYRITGAEMILDDASGPIGYLRYTTDQAWQLRTCRVTKA